MTTELSLIEQVVIQGDLSKLNAPQRVEYYNRVCESLDLNPLTKPFQYLQLNGRLVLYASKECTEQLRKRDGVSITIVNRDLVDGVYVVTAQATANGRTDESIGAVNLEGLKGEAKANAIMKAETKAKRRVTLSICGLGMLDETEIAAIPEARVIQVAETGEILDAPQPQRQLQEPASKKDKMIGKIISLWEEERDAGWEPPKEETQRKLNTLTEDELIRLGTAIRARLASYAREEERFDDVVEAVFEAEEVG